VRLDLLGKLMPNQTRFFQAFGLLLFGRLAGASSKLDSLPIRIYDAADSRSDGAECAKEADDTQCSDDHRRGLRFRWRIHFVFRFHFFEPTTTVVLPGSL
jgi:hypothetical protein